VEASTYLDGFPVNRDLPRLSVVDCSLGSDCRDEIAGVVLRLARAFGTVAQG
jgi:hypothetical protein